MKLRKELAPEVVPAEYMNVALRLLAAFAQRHHYALAYVDSLGVIERRSFAELEHEIVRWTVLVHEHGVGPGDRVIVLAGRDRAWRSALLGLLRAGGVAVPYPATAPADEIRAVMQDAGATMFVSARARPDLAELTGAPVLSADDLDPRAAARALDLPSQTLPGDVALILYAPDAGGFHGVRHTQDSLLAQCEAGAHWLGLGNKEPIWSTLADGSAESIWLFLAAWHGGAELVVVEETLEPHAQLELLDRLEAVALWLSDDEYGALASAAAPAWIDLRSIRRALVSEAPTDGATALADAFGTRIAPVLGLSEVGVVAGWPAGAEHQAVIGTGRPVPGVHLAVVDDEGGELPVGEVGDVVVRGDTRSLFAGYTRALGESPRPDAWFRFGWRGALAADGSLRVDSRSTLELQPVGVEAEVAIGEVVDELAVAPATPPPAAELEAAQAEERRRVEDEAEEQARRKEEQEAKERQRDEERRRREDEKLAARAAAKERKEAEKAAKADEKRRAEDEKRRKQEQRRAEQEAAQRKKAEDAEHAQREAEERRLAQEAESAEREAAKARRQAEEAERRRMDKAAQDDAQRRAKEEKEARRRAERDAKERQNAEEDERRRAEAEEQHRAKDEREREEQRHREEKEARRREEQETKERQKAEEEDRKRAEAEERRRAEREAQQAKELEKAERLRLREEVKNRALAERAAAKEREAAEAEERRRAEEAAHAEREAARPEHRRRADDEQRRERKRHESEKQAREEARARWKRRKEQKRPEPAEPARPEHLTDDMLSRISEYGISARRDEPDDTSAEVSLASDETG